MAGPQQLLCAAMAALALGASGCPLPPQRNPPPAFQTAVTVTVTLPDDVDAEMLLAVAMVAATRLNRSRAPSERPVRVAGGEGPLGASAPGIQIRAPAVIRPAERLVDPLLPPEVVAADADLEQALALYDSVVVVGMAARRQDDPIAWLRAAPGWRLGLGYTQFRDGDVSPTGLELSP